MKIKNSSWTKINSWCKIVYSLKDYFYANSFLLAIYGSSSHDINNQKKQKIYYMISNTFRSFIWIMRCGMKLKHFVLVEELKINLDYLVVLIQFSFWSQLSGTARYNRYNPLKSSSGNLNHLLKLHNNDLWYIYKIFMSRPILITLC